MHRHLLLPSQDLTPRAKDSLVSFGERLSTRIFASYLRVQVGRGQPQIGHVAGRQTSRPGGRGIEWSGAGDGVGQRWMQSRERDGRRFMAMLGTGKQVIAMRYQGTWRCLLSMTATTRSEPL